MIGLGNGLPWERLKSDMDWFRKHTDNKVIVMGRKTWDSIGRKLPNRINVVVSTSDELEGPDMVLPCPDPYTFLDTIRETYPGKDIVIIGGKTLYVQFAMVADVVHITTVCEEYQGDTVFDMRGLCIRSYRLKHQEHLPATDTMPGIIFETFEKIIH